MFYEHKKCMLIRLQQIRELIEFNDSNIIEYQEIVSKAERLVLMAVKYNIKYFSEIHIKMSNYIKDIAAI